MALLRPLLRAKQELLSAEVSGSAVPGGHSSGRHFRGRLILKAGEILMNNMDLNVGKEIGEASIMQTILLNHCHYWIRHLLLDEEGATAIEYGLMAALIGMTVLTAQAAMGTAVVNMYNGAMGIITAALGS